MIYRAFLLLLLVTTINLTSAVAATRDLILIKTTRLIDVRTGELRTDQAILIDGNKIAEVGPSSRVGQGGGSFAVSRRGISPQYMLICRTVRRAAARAAAHCELVVKEPLGP